MQFVSGVVFHRWVKLTLLLLSLFFIFTLFQLSPATGCPWLIIGTFAFCPIWPTICIVLFLPGDCLWHSGTVPSPLKAERCHLPLSHSSSSPNPSRGPSQKLLFAGITQVSDLACQKKSWTYYGIVSTNAHHFLSSYSRSNATTSSSRPSSLPQNRRWERRLGRCNRVKTTGSRHFVSCLFLVQTSTIMMLLCCNGNLDDHWSYCQDPNSSTVVSQKWCWGEKDRRGDLKRFQSLLKAYPSNQASANPLDGCTHVFIEIGSNNDAGMQIRKLFEPQLFQGDPALPIYQRCSAAKFCGSVPSMMS